MTDIKVSTTGAVAKRRKGRSRRRTGPRGIEQYFKSSQAYTYCATWTSANLTSSTAGIITQSISPSISQVSEISALTSLFQSVRLIACRVVLTPLQVSSSNQQGYIMIGTNLNQNLNNTTNPVSMISVENLRNARSLYTGGPRIQNYDMYVPPKLDPLPITADCPTPVNQYAGSPGNVLLYAPFLAASQTYFQVYVRTVYLLSTRI